MVFKKEELLKKVTKPKKYKRIEDAYTPAPKKKVEKKKKHRRSRRKTIVSDKAKLSTQYTPAELSKIKTKGEIETFKRKIKSKRIKDAVTSDIGAVERFKRRITPKRQIKDVTTPDIGAVERFKQKVAPERIKDVTTPASPLRRTEFLKQKKKPVPVSLSKLNLAKTIEQRLIEGQTITPAEFRKYKTDVQKSLKNLTTQQIRQFYNFPKEFSSGAIEVVKEFIMFVPDTIKGAYNFGARYGKSVRARSEDLEVSKSDILIRDFLKANRTANKVRKFVQNHPRESAILVGTVAGALGENWIKDYAKNPAKTLGRAVAFWYAPTLAVKGVKQLSKIKALKKINIFKIDDIVKLDKVIADLKKSGINVRSRGVLGDKLRDALQQKKIYTKLKFKTSAIDKIEKSIITNKGKLKVVKTKPKISIIEKTIKKQTTKQNLLLKEINTLKKKTKLKVDFKPIPKAVKVKAELKLKPVKLPEKELKSLSKEYTILKDNLFNLKSKTAFKDMLDPKSFKRINKEINIIEDFIKNIKNQKILSKVHDFKTLKQKQEFIKLLKKNIKDINSYSNFQKEFITLSKKTKTVPNFNKLLKYSDSQLKTAKKIIDSRTLKAIKLYRKSKSSYKLTSSQYKQLINSLKKFNKGGAIIKKPKILKLKTIKELKTKITKNRLTKTEINKILDDIVNKKKSKTLIKDRLKQLDKNINEIRKTIFESKGIIFDKKKLLDFETKAKLEIKKLSIAKDKIIKARTKKGLRVTEKQLLKRKLEIQSNIKKEPIKILSSSVKSDLNVVKGNLRIGDYILKIEYKTPPRALKISKKARIQNPLSITVTKQPKSILFEKAVSKKDPLKIITKNAEQMFNKSKYRPRFDRLINNQKIINKGSIKLKSLKVPKTKLSSKLKIKKLNLIKQSNSIRSQTKAKAIILLSLGISSALKTKQSPVLISQLKTIQNLIQKQNQIIKNINELQNQILKPIKKLKEKAPTPVKPKKTITKVRTPTKPTKLIKPTPVKPKIPRIKPKPVTEKKIKKFKIPSLTLDSKLPRGQRLSFNIVYRTKGRKKFLETRLPLNMALKKLYRTVDNIPSRSAELIIAGITKKKDIPKPSTVKFRIKKKNSKALDIVEKRKYAFDKKGERRKPKN